VLATSVAYLLGTALGHLYVVALLAGVQLLFSTAYMPFFVALIARDQYHDAGRS
jgi:hypothetical protein